MGRKEKKKLKAHRRNSFFRSRDSFCKIEVIDSGEKVFEHKGKLESGWKKFKKFCVDQYQIDSKITLDMSLIIDGLEQLKIPELPLMGNKNDRRKK